MRGTVFSTNTQLAMVYIRGRQITAHGLDLVHQSISSYSFMLTEPTTIVCIEKCQAICNKMFVVFASIYIYKQIFSSTKINKGKNRSFPTDSNKQSVIENRTSSFKPDFYTLLDACSRLYQSH